MNKDKHIPSGYKSSPLGPIPEDWEVKRLGEICTHFKSGITITSKDIHDDGLYPVYGGNGLRGYANTYTHDGNYILIGRQGALCGNVNYIEGKNYISEHAIAVQTNENMQWLKYKLVNWNLNRFSESSAQPGLSVEKLVRYKLSIPTRFEQNKIAEILSLWDTAIEKQTALIERLTLRKRGLMQQLLTGKKRLEGFSGEWNEVKLGEIGTFFKGSGVPKDSITSDGHKCLTYGDLYTKYDYVISNVKSFIDDNTANNSTKIQYGDICFAGSGETKEDIGKCAAFIDDHYGYAGGDIIVFRAEGFNPTTLSYILNSDSVIRQKSNIGQGHSVVHIYPYQLEKITISIPSIEEQNAIASVLINADKEIELANEKLARLQEEKRGLMQVLLTGKKRVR